MSVNAEIYGVNLRRKLLFCVQEVGEIKVICALMEDTVDYYMKIPNKGWCIWMSDNNPIIMKRVSYEEKWRVEDERFKIITLIYICIHLFYVREIKSSISWCSSCFLFSLIFFFKFFSLIFVVEKKRKCCTNLNCYIIEFGWNLEFLQLRVLLENQYAKSQIGSRRHEWSITQILHDHSWRPNMHLLWILRSLGLWVLAK